MTNRDPWHKEIVELHEFFESYFLGGSDSLERVDAALAPDFSIVGANGAESSRDETMAMLLAGHAHTNSLEITTTDHRLLFETANLVAATYVEHHQLTDRSNHRVSTVIFEPNAAAPNGLQWKRVHETWRP